MTFSLFLNIRQLSKLGMLLENNWFNKICYELKVLVKLNNVGLEDC